MTNQSADKPKALDDRYYATMRQMYQEWVAQEPPAPSTARPKYKKIDSDTPTNIGMLVAVLCLVASLVLCVIFFTEGQFWLGIGSPFVGSVCCFVVIVLTKLLVSSLDRINRSRKKEAYAGTGWLEYDASVRVWKREAENFRPLAMKDSSVRNKLSSIGHYVQGY